MNEIKLKLKSGLRETPEDPRDFPLGALVSLPKLSELPEKFVLETLSLKDQKDSDFCTAFAICLLSEMQEEAELSPEYSFALSKLLSGDVDEWGQDIRKALKPHTKIGALEQKDAPYNVENKPSEFLRRFENWPKELLQKTGFHRKKSYAKITGPYDPYDNIRATIWKFRIEKRGVVSGLIWSWPLSEFMLTGTSNEGFGHAIAYIGWDEKGLILQNSAGENAGVKGRHLISRETVNHFVKRYGAYMLIDVSPEEAKHYLEIGVKLDDNRFIGLAKGFWGLIKIVLKIK